MVSKSRTFSCLPFSLRNFKHTTNTESRKENNPQETPSFKHQQHAAMMEASLPPSHLHLLALGCSEVSPRRVSFILKYFTS